MSWAGLAVFVIFLWWIEDKYHWRGGRDRPHDVPSKTDATGGQE